MNKGLYFAVSMAAMIAAMPAHAQEPGAVEAADEVPLLIKTTDECYPALEAAIRAAHPYELPEVIALPVERGLPAYLAWLAAETLPPPPIVRT